MVGATVEDQQTGRKTDVYARIVINATGPFADSVRCGIMPCPELTPFRGYFLATAQAFGVGSSQDQRHRCRRQGTWAASPLRSSSAKPIVAAR